MIEEVSAAETWARLKSDPTSVLIDVRTEAEWAFVGVPDLDSVGKRLMTLEWQSYPGGQVHQSFAAKLDAALRQSKTPESAELFFICRSGSRSLMAARATAALGWERCRNVTGGFEGGLNAEHHRGTLTGWKAAGLPWVQG